MSSTLVMGPPLESRCFNHIRTRLVLDHYKWDPQVGDRSALCLQPLLMDGNTWAQLARWSEMLAVEITAAEEELAYRPELHRELGRPKALCTVLRRGVRQGFTPCAVRVMRFDFHLTTEGWRVSEVNSDVPGGFTEASTFTRMMAAHYSGARMSGDPLAAWTNGMLAAIGDRQACVLLSAPGYMEDQQVTALLAGAVSECGIATFNAEREARHLCSYHLARWSTRRLGVARSARAASRGTAGTGSAALSDGFSE